MGLSGWEAVANPDGALEASQLREPRYGWHEHMSIVTLQTKPVWPYSLQEKEAQGHAYLQQLHLQGTACFRHAPILRSIGVMAQVLKQVHPELGISQCLSAL